MTNGIGSSLPPILDKNDFLELQNSGMTEIAQLYERKDITELEGANGLRTRTVYVMKDNFSFDGERLAQVESGGRIVVMHNPVHFYQKFFENPNLIYAPDPDPKIVWSWSDGDPLQPTHYVKQVPQFPKRYYGTVPDVDTQRLRQYNDVLQMRVDESDEPKGEWANIPQDSSYMSDAAKTALTGYLDKKSALQSENGFESSFYYYAKLDAYWPLYNNISGENLTINLSQAIEGVGKGNLQTAMVACILYGWFKNAAAVDIQNGTVTFASVLEAQQALDMVFRRPGAAGEKALDPLSNSLSFFVHGLATEDNWKDDFFTSTAWAWKTYDALVDESPTRTVSVDNYDQELEAAKKSQRVDANFGRVPKGDCRYDALILPILTNIATGVTDVYTEDITLYTKEGVHHVADSYRVPVGYRVATAEESVKYWRDHPKTVKKVPKIPGSTIPATSEFGFPDGSITILADEYMLRVHETGTGEAMTVAYIQGHYQPITRLQDYDSSGPLGDQSGWTDLPGWYTYEQAYLMEQLCNLAPEEGGFEATIRRREDEGFQYESRPDKDRWQAVHQGARQIPLLNSILLNIPGLPWTDSDNWGTSETQGEGQTKVAKYAIKFDEDHFKKQIELLSRLIANPQTDEFGAQYIEYQCTRLSVAEAKEVLIGLSFADKGMWEQFTDFVIGNPKAAGLASLVLLALLMGGPKAVEWYKKRKAQNEVVSDYRAEWRKEYTPLRSVRHPLGSTMPVYGRNYDPSKPWPHPNWITGRTDEIRELADAIIVNANSLGTGNPCSLMIEGLSGEGKDWMVTGLVQVLETGYWPDGTKLESRYHELQKKLDVLEFNPNALQIGGEYQTVQDQNFQKFLDGMEKRVKKGRWPLLYWPEMYRNWTKGANPRSGQQPYGSMMIDPMGDGRLMVVGTGVQADQRLMVLPDRDEDMNQLQTRLTYVYDDRDDKGVGTRHILGRQERNELIQYHYMRLRRLFYERGVREPRDLLARVTAIYDETERQARATGAGVGRLLFQNIRNELDVLAYAANAPKRPGLIRRILGQGNAAPTRRPPPAGGTPPDPGNPAPGDPPPPAPVPPAPPTDIVSPDTRATVEAAFHGVVDPGDDIVAILAQRGFTEGQMQTLAIRMENYPNVTWGLYNMRAEGVLLSPQAILQRLNDPGFVRVAGRNYVTPAMVPEILKVYTNGVPTAPAGRQFCIATNGTLVEGPEGRPPEGLFPVSAFVRGAPAYVRPAAGPPRGGSSGIDEDMYTGDDENDDTDPGRPTVDQRLLTQLEDALSSFNPTTELRTMQVDLQRWCRANSDQGGQVGDFLWTTYQTTRAQILTAHPALGFTNAEEFCLRVVQATVVTMNTPIFAQLTNPAQIRQALLTAIRSQTQHLAVAKKADAATKQAAAKELTARVNRVVDDLITRGITTHTPTRTRTGGH